MKVTIYMGSNIGPEVDATNIEFGNPGVGGAHYCMLMLAHFLSKKDNFNISLITIRNYKVDASINIVRINKEDEMLSAAESLDTDILILKQFPNSIIQQQLKKSKLKVIVWSHNFLSYDFCKYISDTPQIKCNVFVGKQQYDAYVDDNVIKKSTYIYNMVTGHVDAAMSPRKEKSKTVVFVGALCRKKGFLEMCKIWPGIVHDVPDAKLIVIGSGNLYGDTKLGKYGLSPQNYEEEFIPFITDKEGTIMPSIEFKGVLGHEKNEIYKTATVGVVNPSGSRETFGMSIVEMGLFNLPVATIGTTGYYDTIDHKQTGYLANNLKDLQFEIISNLKDSRKNVNLSGGCRMKAEEFSPDKIVPMWINLLTAVNAETVTFSSQNISTPYSDNYKWLRIFLRFLRFNLKLKFIPSSIHLESIVKKILR